MKRIFLIGLMILLSPMLVSAFINNTYYEHIGYKFNTTLPLGTLQTLTVNVPGTTQVLAGTWIKSDKDKTIIGNFAPLTFYSWFSAAVAGRLVAHWEVYNVNTTVNSLICSTPETALLGVAIAQYTLACPQLATWYIIPQGNNFTIRLYVRNTAAVATSFSHYYDTAARDSKFAKPSPVYTAVLNKYVYGRGETSTATMTDTLTGVPYKAVWFNNTGGIICSLTGNTPLVSQQPFYKSCLIPPNYLNQSNAYFVFNITGTGNYVKRYFNITRVIAGDITYLNTKLKYDGNMYLGNAHGVDTIVYMGLDYISNAKCHIEITDFDGIPYSSTDTVSNGDGTISFTGILSPNTFEEKTYYYRFGCFCLNSTTDGCVPNRPGMRGEAEAAFEIIPWITLNNFTIINASGKKIYLENDVSYNLTLTNNFVDNILDMDVDYYVQCDDGFTKYLYSETYTVDSGNIADDVTLSVGLGSHNNCRLKAILYPAENVPYAFYSQQYFDIVDFGDSISSACVVKFFGDNNCSTSFIPNEFGKLFYVLRMNYTACFDSDNWRIPVMNWITPDGSLRVYNGEPTTIMANSNCTSSQLAWIKNEVDLVGADNGWYSIYYIFNNGAPSFLGKVYVNGTVANKTLEERKTGALEAIVDKLAELIQVIANAVGFKPFELHMTVSAPDYLHVGEYWNVYAILTDQYNRPLSNYTCSVNTNVWGVIPMNYSNTRQRYEASKYVTTGGTLTWAVTC